jgi:hypothetical protein
VSTKAGELQIDQINDLYQSTPIEKLPNVICFMNRGNLLYLSQLGPPPSGGIHFHPVPEFYQVGGIKAPHDWVLLEPQGPMIEGAALCTFYGMLTTHLATCKLMPILPMEYVQGAISPFAITPVSGPKD